MSIFTKLFDPFFETNKETQSAFDNRFNNFYEKESFRWTTRAFSYLPESESLKIQAVYSKLIPFFECTGLVHINGRNARITQKHLFEQKVNLTEAATEQVSASATALDISSAPCFKWMTLGSEVRKNAVLTQEFGIKDPGKFQILVFKLRSDYALMVVTAQAEPWLKIKLDAFREQIILGYCDNE